MPPGMPAWGSTGAGTTTAENALSTSVSQLAPLAPTWNGPEMSHIQYIAPVRSQGAGPSGIGSFIGKLDAIGKETGHLIDGAAHWVAQQGESAAYHSAMFIPHLVETNIASFKELGAQNEMQGLQSRANGLMSEYKAGHITRDQMTKEMNSLQQDYNQALTRLSSYDKAASSGQAGSDALSVASSLLTVMTGGGAKATEVSVKAAADYLMADAAKSAFLPAEQFLNRVASNKIVMNALENSSTGPMNGIKDAIYGVLFAGAKNQSTAGLSRAAAVNLMFKYPLVYNGISSGAQQVFQDLQTKDYTGAVAQAALAGTMALEGGPVGEALKYGKKTLGLASDAIFGKPEFIKTFAEAINKDPQEILNAIRAGGNDVARSWSALENTNMNAEGQDVRKAVYRIVDSWRATNRPIDQMSEKEIVDEAHNWAKSNQLLRDHLTNVKGMSIQDAERYTTGRWTAFDKKAIASVMRKIDESGARLKAWEDYKKANPNAAFANNVHLDQQIQSIIGKSGGGRSIANKITQIEAQYGIKGLPKSLVMQLAKMGSVPIAPVAIEAPFKESTKYSERIVGELIHEGGAARIGKEAGGNLMITGTKLRDPTVGDLFTRVENSTPVMGWIGNTLTGLGLSPNNATQRVSDIFTGNFTKLLSVGNVLNTKTFADGDAVLKQLGHYMEMNKIIRIGDRQVSTVTDYRFLSTKDIQKALGVGESDAKIVRDALGKGMLQVPIAVRGLGPKLMDANYQFNPASKLFAKVQNATRFAWNPIFQARVSFKYEILSQLEAGGKPLTLLGTNAMLSRIFPEYYNQLEDTAKLLDKHRIFEGSGQLEAAGQEAVRYGSTAHTMYASQRRVIASLVSSMADRMDMPVETFLQVFPNEARDAVRTVTEYNPRFNFLNSPMARTLNVAFFPFRFNLKVAGAITRNIASQPPQVQYAIIQGTMRAHKFLTSQEGQQWYSQNADVIQLATYFSPLETISAVSHILSHPSDVMGYGELGGLPFGMITGLLQSEGMLPQQPYVNAKGTVLPQYIPVDSKGRLQAAIMDFLSVLYTYPGSSIGLTSKTKIDKTVSGWFIPGHSSSDFQVTTPTNLTPQQQQYMQAVQKLNQSQQLEQEQLNPTAQHQRGINVPLQPSTAMTPPPRSTSSKRTKLKKGQFIPELLPGQKKLGEL